VPEARACFNNGDLIPDPHFRDETWSEYRLRAESDRLDHPVTHAQFKAYLAVGLLSPPDENGRWPAATLEALVAIRDLSDSVRSLDRRLIRLAGDRGQFPVPAHRVRDAMIRVIPTIKHPIQKLRRVAAAGRSPEVTQLRHPPRPTLQEWEPLLRNVDLDRFAAWMPGWYAMATTVIPAWHAPNANPLTDIDIEEQILLQGVLDLSQRGGRFPVPG
jgi:hypothetical protein